MLDTEQCMDEVEQTIPDAWKCIPDAGLSTFDVERPIAKKLLPMSCLETPITMKLANVSLAGTKMDGLETPIDGVEAAMDEAGTTITFTEATMDGS